MVRIYLILLAIIFSFAASQVIADQQTTKIKAEVTINMKQMLVSAALAAREKAYVSYSWYKVGAALLTTSGQVITGSNVENASYGLTMCAERSAMFKAVTEGHRDFQMIAIVTADGGYSCGACRQVMNEFNPNLIIIIANETGKIIAETTVSDLYSIF